MIISLVGLPGSGKTTVGRQLARRLQLPFVDSDHVIEQRLGCSIRDYFEREGEESFRDVEQTVLDELTQSGSCVLSTGGGAVIRAANRRHMRQRGKVVCRPALGWAKLCTRRKHDVATAQQAPVGQGGAEALETRDFCAAWRSRHSVKFGRAWSGDGFRRGWGC